MDFREFVAFLRTYIWLILVLLLAGGGAGTALALTASKAYSATSQVLFTGSNAIAGQTQVGSVQYVLLRMPTYSKLASSRAVVEPTITSLHLPTSSGTLAGQVSTDVATGTTVLSITVVQPSAERAQRVAEVLAESLINLVKTTEVAPASKGPPQSAVSARVVTPPQLPTVPSSPSLRLYVVGGALLGTLAGFAIGFIFWIRKRWKREPDGTPTVAATGDAPGPSSPSQPPSPVTNGVPGARRSGGETAAAVALTDFEDDEEASVDQEMADALAPWPWPLGDPEAEGPAGEPVAARSGRFKRERRR